MKTLRMLVMVMMALAMASFPVVVSAAPADLNCDDFVSQAAAQVVLESDPSDPNRLDGNKNGEACEAFPYQRINQPTAVTVLLTDDDITRIADQVIAGVLAGLAADDVPADDVTPGVNEDDTGPAPELDVPDLGITDDGYSVLALVALANFLDSLDN